MSPELALVDAALANELRAILVVADPFATATPARHFHREGPAGEPVDVVPVEVPLLEVAENDPLADLIVQEPDSPAVLQPTFDASEPTPSSDLIVEEPDQQAETSGYPALPAPQDDGPELDATETVLREIRDRLAGPVPTQRRRRFRRRFTVASGLSTAVALGLLAANVSFGVTQLPV